MGHRWVSGAAAAAFAVVACGQGTTQEVAPRDSRVPRLCQGVDVGMPGLDCSGASSGWYYDGSSCAHTDCCVSEQCGALSETLDECELRHTDCEAWRSGKLAFECVAQDAWAPAECTPRVLPPSFAWQGAACQGLFCPCSGLDCDTVWAGQFECAQQHASCDPSAKAKDRCMRDNPAQQVPAGAAFFQDECTRDGASDCNANGFMSQSAVECVALAEGLPQGLNALKSRLEYNVNYRRVAWVVQTTLTRQGLHSTGELMVIDATTGILILKGNWSADGDD